MMNREDKAFQKLVDELSFSSPYKDTELKLAMFLGQVLILQQLKDMLVGRVINEAIVGVIEDEEIKKLFREKTALFEKTASKSGISFDFKSIS